MHAEGVSPPLNTADCSMQGAIAAAMPRPPPRPLPSPSLPTPSPPLTALVPPPPPPPLSPPPAAAGQAPQDTSPVISGRGAAHGGATYRVFVGVCITGIVLVACLLCALSLCVFRRYRAAQRKAWLQFQPPTKPTVRPSTP